MVDAYVADARCGFVATTRLYADLFAGLRVIGQLERVRAGAPRDLPILVFAGSDDPVGGADGTAALVAHYRRAGLTAVSHRVYDGGRHEMFNETDRDEVIDDVVRWLDEHTPTRA